MLEVRPSTDGTIAILAIRTFDPAASWDGFGQALERFASIEPRILDLRGAGGDDPARALELIEALGAATPRTEEVVLADAAWASALDLAAERDPRWSLSAREARPTAVEPGAPWVLIDGGCSGACELAAHALGATRGGATIIGLFTAGTWHLREPRTIELSWSRARVVVPTSYLRVEPEPLIPGRVRPRGWSSDPFAAAWLQLEHAQSSRARMVRFADAHPTCADARPFERLEDLPLEARSRMDAYLIDALRAGEPGVGSIELSLDEARARALLGSCPDVSIGPTHTSLTGETDTSIRAPLSTWILLLQIPAIVRAYGQPPVELD